MAKRPAHPLVTPEVPSGPERHARSHVPRESRPYMNDEFEGIPDERRHELEHVLRVLLSEFEDIRASATQPWKKQSQIVSVIAYGGYVSASGPDPNEPCQIDVLVVVNQERVTSFIPYWARVEDRLLRERLMADSSRPEVNLLVHSLGEINRQIRRGATFFTDIIENGVALYQNATTNFAQRIHVPPDEARTAAQAHFDFWYPLSINARELALHSMKEGGLRDAAFLLHQAVERAYHCVLLVLTLHSPRSHRVEVLRTNGERVAPVLARAWWGDDARRFARLSRAYTGARYDLNYRITLDDLRWIEERVRLLQELVRIEKAIQDLPDPVRHAFIALRLEGLEYEDIAERMGLTHSEVEERIMEALDLIVRALKDSERRSSEIETLH